jgi:hypothetical protein
MAHWRSPQSGSGKVSAPVGFALLAAAVGTVGYFSIHPFFWFVAFVGKTLVAWFP